MDAVSLQMESQDPREHVENMLIRYHREPSPPYELGCDLRGDRALSPLASLVCDGCAPTGKWPLMFPRFKFSAGDEETWFWEHDACHYWAYCEGCRPTDVWPRKCPRIYGHLGASCPTKFPLHHERVRPRGHTRGVTRAMIIIDSVFT